MKIHGHFIVAIFSLLAANANFAQGQPQNPENPPQKPAEIIVDTNGSLKVQSQPAGNAQMQMPVNSPMMQPGPQQGNMGQPQPMKGVNPNMPKPSEFSDTGAGVPKPKGQGPQTNQPTTQSPTSMPGQPMPQGQNPSNPVYPGGVNNPGGPR